MPRIALVLAIVLLAALSVATATAEKREHYKIRWIVYQREHRRSTRLGERVRTLQRQAQLLRQELKARQVQSVSAPKASDWAAKQIAAAEVIARESAGDPWPNCPDPYDGSGSGWQDTVNCENGGNWLDSPGYYRCGLQFDPIWEQRFGRLCP